LTKRSKRNPHDRRIEESDDAYRNRFEIDRDRVLYSSAFRRLAGITQVAAVSERRVLHNRLTHSLKVAQLGRRMAQKLVRDRNLSSSWQKAGQVNADVVEVAGLAHDLGHPPFGHVAESELQKITGEIRGVDGFEGNAQTFRITTKLARRKPEIPGLNLTRASLDAIAKYPRGRQRMIDSKNESRSPWHDRSRGAKWGAYESDLDMLEWVRNDDLAGEVRSPNAILMDWADDVSFATHDIEDYFRANLIPLHSLRLDEGRIAAHGYKRLSSMYGSSFSKKEFEKAVGEVAGNMIKDAFNSTRRAREDLHRYISDEVEYFVKAVRPLEGSPYVEIDTAAQYRVEALKELTFYYVIDAPPLAMMQEGQRRLIHTLFEALDSWLEHDALSARIPVALREFYEDLKPFKVESLGDDEEAQLRAARARAVCDYICTLTESQAFDIFERLSGTSSSSIFGAWFH
jgi:dGTPase